MPRYRVEFPNAPEINKGGMRVKPSSMEFDADTDRKAWYRVLHHVKTIYQVTRKRDLPRGLGWTVTRI